MNIACPSCTTTLAVPDQFAGRKARCPHCQQVFELSLPTTFMSAPPPPPYSMQPPAPPSWDAVQAGSPQPPPARWSCPQCGVALATGATGCPACGWYWQQAPAYNPQTRRRAPAREQGGYCYLFIDEDEVDLTRAIAKRLEKLFNTEQLDLDILDEEAPAPEDLGPDDLVIYGAIKNCDYGSQFIRYFLTIVAWFGPGSCQLDVSVKVQTREAGKHRIKAHSRQAVGFFGGSGPGLMKQNVSIVAGKIATGSIRHATGRNFLNAQAYSCAAWSFGLGLAALIPFIGVLSGLIGLVVGLVASTTISQRDLPRGKGMALAGIILSFCGFLVTAVIVLLMLRR